jgi:DNA-binding FrmR family transcriptional regulator
MSRSNAMKIDRLVERVAALEGEVRGIQETMSPREKLRRVVDRIRKKTKHLSARELTGGIHSALDEVRSGQGRQ